MSFQGEINFDGLIGSTHNYGGLSEGNLASLKNTNTTSNPRSAAIQGIEKMEILMREGIPQGVFLPHERPYLPILKEFGYSGSPSKILEDVSKKSPKLLLNISSASSMWAANAATYSPSSDNTDSLVHITPANLNTMFHRSIEAHFTYKQLLRIFKHQCFKVHAPQNNISGYGDEGAANHLRISESHLTPGIQVFVYGTGSFEKSKNAVKRQAKEISEAIALNHNIHNQRQFFLKQSDVAIAAGSFHNDIVSLANENIFIYHEYAFENKNELNKLLSIINDEVSNKQIIEIKDNEINLDTIVGSYLLNSQLVTGEDGSMILILPEEVKKYNECEEWLEKILEISKIKKLIYVDIRQSMMNGGGPACLRFKTVLSNDELKNINPKFLLNEDKLMQLKSLFNSLYRDHLNPEDLQDPDLLDESYQALDRITQIFDVGNIYEFQQ